MIHGRAIIQGDEVEEFWALKDINFESQQGDRVGIIGRNGAGKSTLLKILSRITKPATGRVTINGRAAGLLEVGNGFREFRGRVSGAVHSSLGSLLQAHWPNERGSVELIKLSPELSSPELPISSPRDD